MSPLSVFGPCQLHVPHKDWADDPAEKQNYEAIEQWSYRLPGCFTAGQVKTHRVHYGMRNWYHTGTHVSVPPSYTVYGANEENIVDWLNSANTISEVVDDSVFVPDNTLDGSIPLLRITTPGLLSWSGIFWCQISNPASGAGGKFDFFDDNVSAHDGDWGQESVFSNVYVQPGTPPVGNFNQALGGSVWVQNDTWLEFAIRQNLGDSDGTVTYGASVSITLTLMEF